ncbi:hypothetical protein Vi05172_g1531 [Venturia inaequalis]|nr:hypothetical protein Vi05172_g1531 [Venturia inaequalis]
MNALDGLRNANSVVVADTADFSEIACFKPSEGTTNPSIIYQAALLPKYANIVQRSVAYTRGLDASLSTSERLDRAAEHLAVEFGVEIYKLTGGISTEVDVTLSFNTSATVDAALRVIELYKQHDVPKEAVRIKIAATWEGIQAARILEEKHGVSVLVTVVLGLVQAIAAAEAGASCIAPYVGPIGDWHKVNALAAQKSGTDVHVGVEKAKEMQNYLRKFGYKTKVMGAGFQSTGQVTSLAGMDLFTIPPELLRELDILDGNVPVQLTAETVSALELPRISYIDDESKFRWDFNADACAVEMSAAAMRNFAADTERLKAFLAEKKQLQRSK